jgi:hypothetical protein
VLTGGGGVGQRRQGRDVRQCEVGRREVGMHGVRSRGVDRAARGRTGGVSGAHAWGRSVGRAWFGWSVRPLGPGDGSLIHHTR